MYDCLNLKPSDPHPQKHFFFFLVIVRVDTAHWNAAKIGSEIQLQSQYLDTTKSKQSSKG